MLYMKKGSEVIQCGPADIVPFTAQGWMKCDKPANKPEVKPQTETALEKKPAKSKGKGKK